MIDTGRGHHSYGESCFLAQFMTKLPDTRVVTVSMSDGIGSNLKNLSTRSSPDYLTWDGKVFKLDLTEMDYYKDNYVTKKNLRTVKESNDTTAGGYRKKFKQRMCELSFEPLSSQAFLDQGINLGVVAFRQQIVYGWFHGYCILERGKIEIIKAFGHVTHAFTRW